MKEKIYAIFENDKKTISIRIDKLSKHQFRHPIFKNKFLIKKVEVK